jgi:hypothetical protein
MISIRTLCLFIALICFSSTSRAQSAKDYTEYHQTMLLVEQWIAEEDFDQAIIGYKALIREYGRLLARDAFNACQIAALLKHPYTDSMYYYSALAGVPEALAKHNIHIAKARMQEIDHFDALYKAGNTQYLSRIDVNLRKEFIERYNREQQMKSDPDYKDVVTANFNRIQQLAAQGKYPGEQTIGVDNNLENTYVTATLLHYPYSYKWLEREIEAGIRRGEIQPLGALYVYGFNQTRSSVLYDQKVPHEDAYFNLTYNLPFGKYDSNAETVNANRAKKMVSSLKVHSDIDRVAKQYRIDYKLGY